jgi:hypothetical protein
LKPENFRFLGFIKVVEKQLNTQIFIVTFMTEGPSRRILEIAEDKELKKRETKEKKIQQAILDEIAECQRKMKLREEEIRVLEKEIANSGPIQAKLKTWKLHRKQKQLEELKRITPSSKSSAVRRMLGE